MSQSRDKIREEVRKDYIIFRKKKCEECGVVGENAVYDANGFLIRRKKGNSNLTVHHKDGDILNNQPENLQTLCQGCHVKKHQLRPPKN